MTEEWRQTHINPNYSVSNLGRVRNDTNGHILKPFKIGTKGNQYAAVDIGKKKSVRVHRLVAFSFLSKPEGKNEVNHKNGDHSDNRVVNLEWVTGSENCIHAYRVLHREKFLGSSNKSAKSIMRTEDGKTYGSLTEAKKDVGLKSHTSISKALKDPNSKAGGFHWKYAEVTA